MEDLEIVINELTEIKEALVFIVNYIKQKEIEREEQERIIKQKAEEFIEILKNL